MLVLLTAVREILLLHWLVPIVCLVWPQVEHAVIMDQLLPIQRHTTAVLLLTLQVSVTLLKVTAPMSMETTKSTLVVFQTPTVQLTPPHTKLHPSSLPHTHSQLVSLPTRFATLHSSPHPQLTYTTSLR